MNKPDNVVETPGLLPYGTNVSAPAIKLEDITAWKSINAIKVNHHLQIPSPNTCLNTHLFFQNHQ